MLHKKKVSLLRKGIAAFLLLLMLGSGFAFAADGTKNTETTKSTESVQPEHMDDGEQNAQDEKETVSAATDESTEKPTETTDVEVEAGTEDAEELVEEIKEEEQIVIFAQGNDRVNKTVKLYYNKKVKYENYRTHDFHVTCDGENIVAYCIEPTQRLGKVRTFTATPCDSALLSKALYYSYGNPGYNTRSAAYLNGLNLKSCYDSTTGRYAFCHVMLSYIFDGESTKGDAFKGCSSNTKTNVKKFVSAIKSWPNPPAKSELGLSSTAFEASWNEELGMQETPEISVTGTEGNSINVPVPDKVTMVKGEEIITTGSVKMSVGESFRLRAPAGLQGQYISPALATAMTDFQPYIIKLSGKQDQMFGINRAQTISYTIKWADFGKVELIKTSSDPSVTDGNGYYSLQGAEYGLYSKETDKKYGNLITDVEGKASIENIPYGEYYLKELEPSRGYDIDVKAHDITVASPSQSETVLEKPIVPDITTNAYVAETGQSSATEGGPVNISDTVKYSGVEPGLTYTIEGRLMNKATGEEVPGTTSQVEFTAEKSSGSLKMDYTLDSSGLGGNTIVAFEKLYQEGNLIATHEDINNEAQSVNFVKPGDKTPDMGDDSKSWLAAFALAMSLVVGRRLKPLKN